MPPSSVKAGRWLLTGLSLSAQFLRRWKIFKYLLQHLYTSLPGTIWQFKPGLGMTLPASLEIIIHASHCNETQHRSSAGEKAAAYGCLGKMAADDPGSGIQGPEPGDKLPAEQLWSTQNVKGWFAKTQTSRFNFPFWLQEIDAIALATSYYMLTQYLKLIYICCFLYRALKSAVSAQLWKIDSKDTCEAMIWLQAQEQSSTSCSRFG